MPGLGFARIKSEKPILFISDIQATLNFNIEGWKKMIKDVKEYAPFAAVVTVGDIYENVELYPQQYEKLLKMREQHAVIQKLFKQLLEATETQTILIVPGNHDVAKYGQDLTLEIAIKLKQLGHKVGYASEALLINYKTSKGERNIFCIHKLGRSYGSQVAALTYTIYRNALEFIQHIQQIYKLVIHDFVYGHIHRPAQRFGAIRFLVLGGWNRDRFYVADPSTVTILRNDFTAITLDYPQTLDLEENERIMRAFATEAIEEYISDIKLPKPEKQKVERNNEQNMKIIFNENLENFTRNNGKKNKNEKQYFMTEITEILKTLNWQIIRENDEKRMIIKVPNDDDDKALLLEDLHRTLEILGIMHTANFIGYDSILEEPETLIMKIYDVEKLAYYINDEEIKAYLED